MNQRTNMKCWKRIPLGSWMGIKCQDDIFRFGKRTHDYRESIRGRIGISFTKQQLIRIAWQINITNHDGFDYADCLYLGVPSNIGYLHYINGWQSVTKDVLSLYIWNKLEETDRIITI